MKKLILICLLGASAVALAQTPPDTASAPKRGGKSSEVADVELNRVDDAKLRAELDEARRRLDEAARQVAELSMQLGNDGRGDVLFLNTDGPRRAVLGVQIDSKSGKEGARVLEVSPGGAAEQAGLANGDVIVALDGKAVAGSEMPGRVVVDYMRDVKPEQKVKVKVLRSGKNKDFVVVARPMPVTAGRRALNIRLPEGGAAFAGPMPQIHTFRNFWHGEFGGMELASITPKLGAYFGANSGVLVVKAPDNEVFKLEDGDVIQSIDGRKPEDGAHALRILRSYKTGEKLSLQVLRQRKPVTLAVTMPDRPEWDDDFPIPPMPAAPAVAPAPPVAPAPAVPRSPGGAATLE